MKEKPKKVAKEMVAKFFEITGDLETAKHCAELAVDYILAEPATFDSEQVKYSDGSYAREYYEVPSKYWTRVKQKITK